MLPRQINNTVCLPFFVMLLTFFVCKVSINLCIMQDFSSFFFPQIRNSHFISVYLQPKKAHDNNTYHFGYYGSPVHLGQGEGRHRGAYRPTWLSMKY